MRTLLLALSLVLASTAAHAQTCTVAQAAEDPSACGSISLLLSQKNPYEEARRLRDERDSALTLRNMGIAATTIGTIGTIVGAALVWDNFCMDDCNSNATAASAGAGLLVLGQLGVAAGIPMWVTGGVRAAKAERATLSLSGSGLKGTF